MQSHVAVKHLRVDKRATTNLTDVALFRRMRGLVCLQIGGCRELLCTDFAHMHLIAGMLQHVIFHLVQSLKPLAAYLARKLLGQVNPSVIDHMLHALEHTSTCIAVVRTLGTVGSRMRLELGQRVKPLLATATLEVRDSFVAHHVGAQVCRLGKLATTDLARER